MPRVGLKGFIPIAIGPYHAESIVVAADSGSTANTSVLKPKTSRDYRDQTSFRKDWVELLNQGDMVRGGGMVP